MYRSGKMIIVTLLDGREMAINTNQIVTVEKNFNPAFDTECCIIEFGTMTISVKAKFLDLVAGIGLAR